MGDLSTIINALLSVGGLIVTAYSVLRTMRIDVEKKELEKEKLELEKQQATAAQRSEDFERRLQTIDAQLQISQSVIETLSGELARQKAARAEDSKQLEELQAQVDRYKRDVRRIEEEKNQRISQLEEEVRVLTSSYEYEKTARIKSGDELTATYELVRELKERIMKLEGASSNGG